MHFNPKIDKILDVVKEEDRICNKIVSHFNSILPSDVCEDIEKGCSSYIDDFNYTYCDNDNDMYEVGYYSNPMLSDLTIYKHKPAYDKDNNYIGRRLMYLLRVITNNNGQNLCYVYSKGADYTYNKTYKITACYEKTSPQTLKRKK